MVWLASDEDREGEAISWHLFETLGLKEEKTKRIVFHEITKPAILKAIESPRSIDYNLVNAQQARRVLDRLVGFELSPVLWKKVKPSLSAGRVQSVAVRLIVDREREVNQFNAEAAFKVVAIFSTDTGKELFKAELGERFSQKGDAEQFLTDCKAAIFTITSLETKPSKRSPAAPFTTSTLQQEASRKLGFSVARTMSVAQKLYEAGKITYMRTDSVNLAEEAVAQIRDYIAKTYGKENVPDSPRVYKSKSKNAQEAHEAIRPTNIYNTPANVKKYLSKDELSLYTMIYNRALASLMKAAIIKGSTLELTNNGAMFKATAQEIVFDGYLKVYGDYENVPASKLPTMDIGSVLKAEEIEKNSNQLLNYTNIIKKNTEEVKEWIATTETLSIPFIAAA